MRLRMLVLALIAALGSGCASTDKARLAYEVKPDSTVRHGAPNAQSYYQLARYYHGQKRLDMAETAYIKAIALDSRQVDAYNALGSLYAERGQLERSVQQFEKALQIAPRTGYVHNNLGFAYFLQGRLDKAYEAIRNALTLDPKLERGWVSLERIAAGQSNASLTKVARSRRVEDLPATLLASATPKEAIGEPTTKVMVLLAEAQNAMPVGSTPESIPSIAAVANAGGSSSEIRVAERSETKVQVAANPTVTEWQSSSHADGAVEGGKFVLVSTDRQVVNLAERVLIVQMEPAVQSAEPRSDLMPARNSDVDLDVSGVKVEVSNANGVNGFARKFSAQLRKDNIPVKRITNHGSFLLRETLIEYQPGYQNAARTLMFRTQLVARLVPAKGKNAGSDVRIVLGRDALLSAKMTLARLR